MPVFQHRPAVIEDLSRNRRFSPGGPTGMRSRSRAEAPAALAARCAARDCSAHFFGGGAGSIFGKGRVTKQFVVRSEDDLNRRAVLGFLHAKGIYQDALILNRGRDRVLRSRYELTKAEIPSAFSTLLDTADLAFEDEPSVENALCSWKDSVADFADCLIEARNRRLGCQATVTFDAKALKLAGFISVSGHTSPRDGGKDA